MHLPPTSAFTVATRLPIGLLLVVSSAAALAQAPALNDPTRPAPGWAGAQNRPASLPAAQPAFGGGGGGEPAPAATSAPTQVQIVLSGADRRFVVADGHTVHVGGTHNGMVLTAINAGRPEWKSSAELAKLAAAQKAAAARAAGPAKHPPKKANAIGGEK